MLPELHHPKPVGHARRSARARFSVKDLDKIPSIELTPELANPKGNLSPEQAYQRMQAALHEAAHLVGALACRKISRRGGVALHITLPPGRRLAGSGSAGVSSMCDVQDAVISLAGWAWELRHGDPSMWAEDDLRRSLYYVCLRPVLIRRARTLVAENESVIRHAAVGLLKLCRLGDGRIDGLRLKHLRWWLEDRVRPIPDVPDGPVVLPHIPPERQKRVFEFLMSDDVRRRYGGLTG